MDKIKMIYTISVFYQITSKLKITAVISNPKFNQMQI